MYIGNKKGLNMNIENTAVEETLVPIDNKILVKLGWINHNHKNKDIVEDILLTHIKKYEIENGRISDVSIDHAIGKIA